MTLIKTLSFAAIFVASARCLAVNSAITDDPRELLFDAIEKGRWLSFESLVMRRESGRDRGFMQVRITQKAGVSKTVVLAPLPNQGVTTIDDGKSWSTYIPDENRIMIIDSPKKSSWYRKRKTVAADNYRFTSEAVDSIAGRKAIAVTATPKAPEMPVRRFWIDSEYPLMLRMETESGGRHKLMMDTKAISFMTVSDNELAMNAGSSARQVYLDSPERFRTAAEAIEIVGFKPAMPGPLPFGFAIAEPQIIGEKGSRFVAIRISDGLAAATVYQWDARTKNPVPCNEKELVREAHGLKLRMSGDLPEVVMARLLDAFVREALKGLQALLGTDFDPTAFHSIQDGPDGGFNGIVIVRVAP